jgi:hypothetical protein
MTIKEINYDVIQGDTWSIDITVQDETGAYINFNGYTFDLEVRDKEGGKILCAVAGLGDGITVPSLGKIHVELSSAKTAKFNFPKSKYQLQSIDSSNRRKTILTGWFNVKAGVINV